MKTIKNYLQNHLENLIKIQSLSIISLVKKTQSENHTKTCLSEIKNINPI